MITNIKDFKIMLETVGHMGFTPEMPISNSNNQESSESNNDRLEGLKLALLSIKVLFELSAGLINTNDAITKIQSLYLKYSPYPNYVNDKLMELKSDGLTNSIVDWFSDIDSEYLMEHPEYDLYLDEINNYNYKIKAKLKKYTNYYLKNKF